MCSDIGASAQKNLHHGRWNARNLYNKSTWLKLMASDMIKLYEEKRLVEVSRKRMPGPHKD